MPSTASRRTLLAGLIAAAPTAALAQLRLPKLPSVSIPKLPFGRRETTPAALKLTGKRPDLTAVLKETGAPAVAAAAVTPKGLAFVAAAGLRRLGEAAPVMETDVWRLGGCSQVFHRRGLRPPGGSGPPEPVHPHPRPVSRRERRPGLGGCAARGRAGPSRRLHGRGRDHSRPDRRRSRRQDSRAPPARRPGARASGRSSRDEPRAASRSPAPATSSSPPLWSG